MEIRSFTSTGLTLYSIIRREVDGFLLDDADGSFAAAPADPFLSLTEDGTISGFYEVSEIRIAWDDGEYLVFTYSQAGGSPVPASDTVIDMVPLQALNDVEVTHKDLGDLATRLTSARAAYLDYLTYQVSIPAAPAFSLSSGDIISGTYDYAVSALSPWGESLLSAFDSHTVVSLTVPNLVTFTENITAGTLAAGTYFYRVSAINSYGETLASVEASVTLSAIGTAEVKWASSSGATGYKIYGRSTGAELLMATVGGVNQWDDDGSVTPAGALPIIHTADGVQISWPAVLNATGYKIYGRNDLSMLFLAEVGAGVTSWDDDGSITPSGSPPSESSVGLESQIADLWTALAGVQATTDKLSFDSNNSLFAILSLPSGIILYDASNTATTFLTDLSFTATSSLDNMWVNFRSGALGDQVRKVSSYDPATKFVTVASPFSETPIAGDQFILINR